MSRWPSPAKLNLFLYITGQRADGYHTLQTLFQFLDYGDTLTIEPRTDGQLRLLTPVAGVPDEENLIVRAARLLMRAASESDRLPAGSGADISVDKRLPMGGRPGRRLIQCRHRAGGAQPSLGLRSLGRGAGDPGPSAGGRCAGLRARSCRLCRRGRRNSDAGGARGKMVPGGAPGVSIPTPVIFRDPELPRNTPRRSINTLLNCEFSNDCELIARKRFREVDAALPGC